MDDAEARVAAALTIPAVLESEDQAAEIADELDRQLSRWIEDPPAINDPVHAYGNAVFFLGYYGFDARPLIEKIAQMHRRASPALAFTASHCETIPAARDRLRVGFISRYFVNHTVSKLTSGLISGLGGEDIETVLLRFPTKLSRVFDAVRAVKFEPHMRKIEAWAYPTADRTVDLSKDIITAREQIASLELDALVYVDIGQEPTTYFLAHARLAPVQCALWGHPVTTGLPTIDYYVSADAMERPGAEADYTEQLVRLERIPAYYYRPPPPDDSFARGARGHLYGCPQSPFKFLPAFDVALSRLLQADPSATLLLLGEQSNERVAALSARLSRALGDAFDRITFLPWAEREGFLSMLRGVDALLDPFHFGGGNTSFESLSVGAPVVTMPGRFMRGRITAACYTQMGVPGLTADDVDSYVQTAIALAGDAELREHKRRELLDRSDELFEDRSAIDAFRKFLWSACGAQR